MSRNGQRMVVWMKSSRSMRKCGTLRWKRQFHATPAGRRMTSWIIKLLLVCATCATFANAQSAPRVDNNSPLDGTTAVDALRTIDQLVKQNEKLQEQNRELMSELQKLRGVVARQANAEPDSPSTVAKQGAANTSAGPSAENITHATGDTKNIDLSSTAANSTPQSSASTPTQSRSAAGQSSQNQSSADDKTELPEASDGNSA